MKLEEGPAWPTLLKCDRFAGLLPICDPAGRLGADLFPAAGREEGLCPSFKIGFILTL
jgi:hypothetical protein